MISDFALTLSVPEVGFVSTGLPRETSRAGTSVKGGSSLLGRKLGLILLSRGHIVLVVTFSDGERWVTDVCFGGDGPTQPMRLMAGSLIRNMGTQDARLIRGFIPGLVSRAPEHMVWQYQYRNSEVQPWQTFYCFSDAVEWLPQDFEVINCFTGGSLESSAVTSMCVVKFLKRDVTRHEDTPAAEHSQQEIFGKRMLVNEVVKENLGGKTKIVQECRSEEERIDALRVWFGIELTEDEGLAIKGHMTELK